MDPVARLLDDIEHHRWPAGSDEDSWAALANWAFQTECLQADEAENIAWEKAMRELLAEKLPYREFTERRMAALEDRLRTRKLTQTNLRYRYGFKPRRDALVRRDVRRFIAAWSES